MMILLPCLETFDVYADLMVPTNEPRKDNTLDLPIAIGK